MYLYEKLIAILLGILLVGAVFDVLSNKDTKKYMKTKKYATELKKPGLSIDNFKIYTD